MRPSEFGEVKGAHGGGKWSSTKEDGPAGMPGTLPGFGGVGIRLPGGREWGTGRCAEGPYLMKARVGGASKDVQV